MLKHLFIAATILIVMLGSIFLSFPLLEDIWNEPNIYFHTELSREDIQFNTVFTVLITTIILVCYIVYLLLSLNTRAGLLVASSTKELTLHLNQFKRIYEEAPVPYITLNNKAEIKEPNKATLRFFGVTPEEIEAKNIFSFLYNEDKKKAEKLLQYYEASIPIDREEIRMITKTGAVKWVLLSVFRMRDPISFGRAGLATIFDITSEKRLDQAKTEFVSLASHQLRSPAATIKWYAEMLSSANLGELSPKQSEYLNIIYEANREMIELIDTLLNISRIEIGSLPVESKPTNVQELCQSVLVELSAQIERSKIQIQRNYNNSLSNIKNDPKLLRIIIQNLLSNAIKYTPEGGTVTIDLEQFLGNKSIIIRDTGIGIPKSEQDKIFNKMFRAENTRNLGGTQGTGFGLYLVKSLVEALGGSIDFKSEENKGTIFTVKL